MLGNCTQLTSVNFYNCKKITGACCLEERSFLSLRTSALFLEEFSCMRILLEFSRVARRTCRNFLEFSSLYPKPFAHSPPALPACLLILFHSGDIQVLEKCTQLTKVNFYECRRITGACCLEERSFSRLRPSALFWKKFLL